MIKTFRGQLTDTSPGNQNRIRLSTIKGKVGYRIVKFQLMTEKPGTTDYEQIVKIFKTSQSSIVEAINFTDSDLLAAGFTEGAAATNFIGNPMTIIYDHVLFVRNIHVTHVDTKGALNCNYYIELEEVKVSAAGMAQLGVAAARRRQVDA